MSVTLVIAQSLDGKLTRTSSPEDQVHFQELKEKYHVIVMGRKTYEHANIALSPKWLRIVMTRNPQKYTNIPGQLEFTSQSPEQIVKRYKTILLAGGNEINTLFFEKNLITECFITIEPKNSLHLKDIKKLNNQGSIVLHYAHTNN